MSNSIYVKIKLQKNFYDIDTSKFLFKIIKEGCSRRIAMMIISEKSDFITCEANECVLSLSDSFNFQLVVPLMGNDFDYEVTEYRPEKLYTRLLNLQELFQFIFKEDIVKKIEVLFTLDYDVEKLETIDIKIDNFAKDFETIITENYCLGMHYRFYWIK
jgi:hypothetical protein